jgi:hypothetical protein
LLCPLGSRDLFVTGPGPASDGPKPSPGCAHRPERAGIVAGPCPLPTLPPADGVVDWPKTGVAVVPAHTIAKRKMREKFMTRLAFRVPLIGYNLSKGPESLPRTSRGRSISAMMQKRHSAPMATRRQGDCETARRTFRLKGPDSIGYSQNRTPAASRGEKVSPELA